MNLDVIGQLSEEDLGRYRRAMAKRKLAEMGHLSMGLEEAIEAMVDYDRCMQDILVRYEIEQGQCPMISSVDGTIAEKL
jgi:hypothetical protein